MKTSTAGIYPRIIKHLPVANLDAEAENYAGGALYATCSAGYIYHRGRKSAGATRQINGGRRTTDPSHHCLLRGQRGIGALPIFWRTLLRARGKRHTCSTCAHSIALRKHHTYHCVAHQAYNIAKKHPRTPLRAERATHIWYVYSIFPRAAPSASTAAHGTLRRGRTPRSNGVNNAT